MPFAQIMLVVFVDGDGAVEGAVDGVAAQQGGALDQVVVAVFAHDDGAQAAAAVRWLRGQ